jgi:hypothetical protein
MKEEEAWIIVSDGNKFFDGLDEKWSSIITEATLFPKKTEATRFISNNFNKKMVFPRKVKIVR